MCRRARICLAALLLVAACHVRLGSSVSGEGDLFRTYLAFEDALAKGDVVAAKGLVPAAKSAQLDAVPSDKVLAELTVLSPLSDLKEKDSSVTGNVGLLTVKAQVLGNDATGRIRMVREQGSWKIASERWNIGPEESAGSAGEAEERPRTAAERQAISRLEEKGYHDPIPGQMVSAAGSGDVEAIRLFVQLGFTVNEANGDLTPLVSAIESDHPDAALVLIENGAKIDTPDDHGVTALMAAARKCEMTPVVKALLDRGANSEAHSATGKSALDMARDASCSANIDLLRGPAQY